METIGGVFSPSEAGEESSGKEGIFCTKFAEEGNSKS